MRLNGKTLFLALIASAVVAACTGTKNEDKDDLSDEVSETTLDSQKISAQNVFNALPDRDRVIGLAASSKAEYNPTLLNDPELVNKYTTETAKALNLGVYGADLNATGVFEQTQESMLFLKCVNILAKSLGVSNAFDEKMVDRMTANKSNRDSTLEIVSQSFKTADTYLKENGRPGTSSLIVAGAWIEGMYLGLHTAKETGSDEIRKELARQGESLKYLVQLLGQSRFNAEATYVLEELKAMQPLFEAGNGKTPAMDRIEKQCETLRTKITSGKS